MGNIQPSSELSLGSVKCVEVCVEEWIDVPKSSVTAGAISDDENESDVSNSDDGWESDNDEPGAIRKKSTTLMGDMAVSSSSVIPIEPPSFEEGKDDSRPVLPADPADKCAEGMHEIKKTDDAKGSDPSIVGFSDVSIVAAELEHQHSSVECEPGAPVVSGKVEMKQEEETQRLFRISEIVFEVQNDFELDLNESGIGGLTGEGQSLDVNGVPIQPERPSDMRNDIDASVSMDSDTDIASEATCHRQLSQSLDMSAVSDSVYKAVKTQAGRYELWKPDSSSQSKKEAIKIKTIRDRRTGKVKGLKPIHWYYFDILTVPSHLPFPDESSNSKSLVDYCSFQRAADGKVFHWRSLWFGNVKNGDLIRYSNSLSKKLNRVSQTPGTMKKETVHSSASSEPGSSVHYQAAENSTDASNYKRSSVDTWVEYFKFKDQFMTAQQLKQKPRNAAMYHRSSQKKHSAVKSGEHGELDPAMICTDHRMSLTEFLDCNDNQHVMEFQFTLGRYVRMKTHKVNWGKVYVTIPDYMIEQAIAEAKPVLAPLVLEDEVFKTDTKHSEIKGKKDRKSCRIERQKYRRERRKEKRQRKRAAKERKRQKKYHDSKQGSEERSVKDVGFAVMGDVHKDGGFETPAGGESSASPSLKASEEVAIPMSNDDSSVLPAAVVAASAKADGLGKYDVIYDDDWDEKQHFTCSPHVLPPPLRNIDPAVKAMEIGNGISTALSHARKSTTESLKSAVSSAALSLSESMMSQSGGNRYRKSAMSLDVMSQSHSAPPVGAIDQVSQPGLVHPSEYVTCPLCLIPHIHRTQFKRHINEECTQT